MIARVVMIMLLWAACVFAQEPGADAQSPLPCPHAADIMAVDDAWFAMAGDEPETPPQPRSGMERRMGRAAERGRQIERLRTQKLLELLDLSAAQEKEFLETFRAMRRENRQIDEERRRVVAEMAELARGRKRDQDSLNLLIDRLMTLERERQRVKLEFVNAMRNQLTAEQVAKLIVFEERFEMQILEKMRDFRQHRMGVPPGGSRGPHVPASDSDN